jgi:integrase
MAGVKRRINRKSVAGLQRGEWITDDILPGFKVRRPNRLALYGVNIRLSGRMRWISLGSEAELTPDQARGEAERIRGLKRQGIDPAAQRDRRNAGATLKAAAERFVKEHVQNKLRPRTAAHYEEMIDRLILPKFGKWRIGGVTRSDVGQWHGGMHRTPIQANRALAILSSLMAWAVDEKLREGNPCVGTTRFREKAVNRYPTPADVSRIVAAMDELLDEGAINPFFVAGAKVLLMTGARRSEVFEAEWEWLDVDRRALILPDSKTGEKVIAIPDAAVAIVLALPRMQGCRFIFPSLKTDRPFVNFTPMWKAVLERAKVGRWRLHDLRHAFASAAVVAGAPIYVVGRQLGHAKPATTGRYAHVSDDPKRAVVETVAGLFGAERKEIVRGR